MISKDVKQSMFCELNTLHMFFLFEKWHEKAVNLHFNANICLPFVPYTYLHIILITKT